MEIITLSIRRHCEGVAGNGRWETGPKMVGSWPHKKVGGGISGRWVLKWWDVAVGGYPKTDGKLKPLPHPTLSCGYVF